MAMYTMEPEEIRTLIKKTVIETVNQCFVDYIYKLSSKSKLISIEELIDILKCSKQTIYNWKKKGLIKDYKMENKVLYNMDEIQEGMRQNPRRFGNENKLQYMFNAFAPSVDKEVQKYHTLNSRKVAGEHLSVAELRFLEENRFRF